MELDEENHAQFCRVGVGYPFWEISSLSHGKYQVLKKEFESKYDPNSEESWYECHELEEEKDHNGYIAIIFSAIYIESEIYTYLAIHLSDTYVKKYLDKLDLLSKLVVGLKLVTGCDFPTGSQAFEECKKLISYRNKIVHHKSKPYNFNAENVDKLTKQGELEFHEMVGISQTVITFLEREISKIHKGIAAPFMVVRESPLNNAINSGS